MNFVLSNQIKRHVSSIALLIAGICLVWYLLPTVAINHGYPFIDPNKRLILIILLIGIWALHLLYFDFMSNRTSNLTMQMLQTLKGRFTGAVRFLKKTAIDKHGYMV